MNIEIRRLTPDLAEAYVHFFDVTPHDVKIDEQKCYCVVWRNDETYTGDGDHWFPTREERRARALQYVKDGSIQGYLAYCGGEIVGWCNATADCQSGVNFLREYWPIEPYRADIKVKSVFCFMIAPQMQRKGIATQLLQRVCKDAADDGFDFVEAYTGTESSDELRNFRGTLALYEKCGFSQCAERDGNVVMRRALKRERIDTERLTIRPFAEGDLDDLTALIRDKMAGEYAPYDTQWPTDDASMREILAYFMGEVLWCWCAVELNAIGRVIGFVCAGRADDDTTRGLGYTIHSDHQNNGYAHEACRALMQRCEETLGTRRFVAGTADYNTPSVKLLHKLGFSKVESITGSFTKDSEGNPIPFAAGKYERIM